MRAYKFNLSFFLLPVFFFVLAISPNINGDRIGLVLFSVYILLIPATNYLSTYPWKRKSEAGDVNYVLVDFLALLLLLIAIYLGWQISWQFTLLQTLYLFLVLLISKQERTLAVNNKWITGGVLQGIVLFALIYLGLNQYGFENLLRLHIALFASLTIIIFITSNYILQLRDYYLVERNDNEPQTQVELKPFQIIPALISLLLISLGGFLFSTYNGYYSGLFVLAILPSMVMTIRLNLQLKVNNTSRLPVSLNRLNVLLSTGLIIFFIYFFLASTQVLQAIQGGY